MITKASNGMEKMLSLWVFRFWWEEVFIWKLTSEAFINGIKNHTRKVEEIMRGIPSNLQVLLQMKFHLSIFGENWDQVQITNLYLPVFFIPSGIIS